MHNQEPIHHTLTHIPQQVLHGQQALILPCCHITTLVYTLVVYQDTPCLASQHRLLPTSMQLLR